MAPLAGAVLPGPADPAVGAWLRAVLGALLVPVPGPVPDPAPVCWYSSTKIPPPAIRATTRVAASSSGHRAVRRGAAGPGTGAPTVPPAGAGPSGTVPLNPGGGAAPVGPAGPAGGRTGPAGLGGARWPGDDDGLPVRDGSARPGAPGVPRCPAGPAGPAGPKGA